METLCANYTEAGIGVTKDEDGIRLDLNHKLVTLGNDVAHCLTEVLTYGLHINVRVCKLKILEENTVEVVIVVLAGMSQKTVEVLTAFVDYCSQTDDLWTCANNDEKLEFAVIFKLCHIYFPLFLFYRIEKRIRFVWIEDLIAIHHCHEILGVTKVDDVVSIAWEHMDGLDVVSINFPFNHLALGVIEVTLLDEAMALDNDELLKLGVVPMLALCNARFGDVDGHLTCVESMDQFSKGATLINIHLKRECNFFLWKIAEIRAVEFLCKRVCWNLRNHQGLRLGCKRLEEVHNLT